MPNTTAEARAILLAQLKRLDNLAASLEKEYDDLSPINSQTRIAEAMCRIAATLGDARPMYNNDVPNG